MLQRIQSFAQAKPFTMWLLSVAFLLALNLTVYFAVPGTHNAGLFMMYTVFAFSGPTRSLVQRMSDVERENNPVSLRQEQTAGVLSVCLAWCSIASLLVVAVGKHVGLVLSDTARMYLLMLFSFSGLLACALGYAARRTRAGRFGLHMALEWLAVVFSIAALVIVSLTVRHKI